VQLRTPHGLTLVMNTEVQISTTLGSIGRVEYLGLGLYSATLTSQQAGVATITAVANGVELQQKQTVTFAQSTPVPTSPRRRSVRSGD
jgi:hypothetical protein